LEEASDFELQGYPSIGIYNEFSEVMTSSVSLSAANAADRFLHKIGVFSSCNSFDESTWNFDDYTLDLCSMSADGNYHCEFESYDLAENNGEFYGILAQTVMESFHLSSASCFETLYEIFNEDGSEYTGPLYIEDGFLRIENPYAWVDETLIAKIEVTMQQPISENGFTLPALIGNVNLLNSGEAVEPEWTCDDN
jgi:hypothetical protein